MDQKQLIDRCRQGDMDSFEELYLLYKQKALGTAYLIGGSKSIAEDIVQEAFVICYYQIKNLKNPDVFNIWFYRLLVRVGWRMASKYKNHISFDNPDTSQDCSNTQYIADGYVDTSNDRMLVREAVKRLPPHLKTVVILYYFNELSTKEIAKILNCFQGTIKSRLHKARKLLEKELGSSIKNDAGFRVQGKEFEVNGKQI